MFFKMCVGFLILFSVTVDGLHSHINPPLFFDSSQDLGFGDTWLLCALLSYSEANCVWYGSSAQYREGLKPIQRTYKI